MILRSASRWSRTSRGPRRFASRRRPTKRGRLVGWDSGGILQYPPVSSKEPMELGYPHLHFTAGFWWGRSDGDRVRLGITRQAAEQLTYVTHVELPAVGASFRAGEPVGVIESQKVVSDLFAPMNATVVEHNPPLADHPLLLTPDPQDSACLLL